MSESPGSTEREMIKNVHAGTRTDNVTTVATFDEHNLFGIRPIISSFILLNDLVELDNDYSGDGCEGCSSGSCGGCSGCSSGCDS